LTPTSNDLSFSGATVRMGAVGTDVLLCPGVWWPSAVLRQRGGGLIRIP
jgi:hypothetical protein